MTNLTNSRTLGILSVVLLAIAVQTSMADITVTSESATSLTGSGNVDIIVQLTEPELSGPPIPRRGFGAHHAQR